tara:strand:- start:1029 stop:1436 length:408 start_codon:yes stop_codon:yes gene_type:complete
LRACGCEDRGRHRRTCIKHIERAGQVSVLSENDSADFYELYIAGYGKPPHLSWYPNKSRQSLVERRIEKLIRRYKAFYLTTSSLDNSSEEEETWFIDGGNWASKKDLSGYNIPIGHIKNCLEFLNGRQPKWRKTE